MHSLWKGGDILALKAIQEVKKAEAEATDIIKNAKKICYLKDKIDTKIYKTFKLSRKEY